MESPIATVPHEYGGIQCTAGALREVNAGRVMVEVPRDQVIRITARHGIQAHNPLVQVIAGAVLIAVGYVPVLHLINWFRYGGRLITYAVMVLVFPVIGLLTALTAFRRGYFLDVELPRGRRRLVFSRKVGSEGVQTFSKTVEALWNIPVETGAHFP